MARTDAGTLHATPEDGRDYAEVPIPEGLATRTSTLVGTDETPQTLGEILAAHDDTGAFVPEDATWEDMLVSEKSRHRVRVGDEEYNTYCVLDALVLPFLLDETVEISSTPPGGGSAVEIVAGPDELEARPETTVVSFGVSLGIPEDRGALEATDPEQLQELIHAEGCPRINAFPDREAYQAWADEVEAVTVAVSLAQAYAMAKDAAPALQGEG